MKKLFLILCLMFSAILLHAQTYHWWTWKTYKVKFKTLDDFKITANNADEFKAENVCIGFDIYPHKSEALSNQGMKNSLLRWANQCDLTYDLNKEPVYININHYRCVGLDASWEGVPVSIFLLTDPDFPDLSFYVWFDYDHPEDAKICLNIIKSFTPS